MAANFNGVQVVFKTVNEKTDGARLVRNIRVVRRNLLCPNRAMLFSVLVNCKVGCEIQRFCSQL